MGSAEDTEARAVEHFQEQLLACLAEGVFGVDLEGRFTFLNPAACRLLGFAEEAEAIGGHAHALTHAFRADGGPYPAGDCPIQHVLQTGRALEAWEDLFWRQDGSALPVLVYAAPLRRGEGASATGAVVSFQDITERRAAERALREREAELAEAQALARLGSWVSDLRRNEIRWSREVYRIFGMERSQWGATHEAFMATVHAEDRPRVQAAIDAALQGAPYDVRHRIVRPDGSVRTVHERGSVTFDEEGRPERMIGTVQDVTEQRAQEQALHALQAVTGNPRRSLDRKLRELLELGREIFALDGGCLIHLTPRGHRLRQAAGRTLGPPGELLAPGSGPCPCTALQAADGPLGYHDLQAAPAGETPPGEVCRGSCLAMPIPVEGEAPEALLLFSSGAPRAPFSEFEREFLTLMGQWVSYELHRERQRHALERERNLFIGGPTVVFHWDSTPGWPIRHVSPNVAEVLGYRPERLLGYRYSELVHPADLPQLSREMAEQAERGDTRAEFTPYRLLSADRGYRWIYESTVIERGERGEIGSLHGYLIDITERVAMESQLRLLAATFRSSHAVFITDAEGAIQRVNPAFTQLTGYTDEEAIGHHPGELLHSGYQGWAFYQAMFEQLKEQGAWEGEIWDQRKDGAIIPLYMSVSVVRDQQGAIEHYVAVCHDISRQKQLEAELERQAFYDRLTEVSNRRHFESLLEQESQRAHRYGHALSLVFLDVDHFKALNDTYGHEIGDRVLVELVQLLQQRLRASDLVGRWGGEEFLVMLPETPAEQARQVAESLRAQVQEGLMPGAGAITISLGVAAYQPGEALKDFIKRADDALYSAKYSGRNCVVTAG
ncbi:sensor domain-containing diguanylate cyclase [Halorhodospira neutriphila]|uniref:PAS domain S-box protein n=1 Tax=Halorhodospira neutriphila TaxID=168379 RepID=UPI00190666F6